MTADPDTARDIASSLHWLLLLVGFICLCMLILTVQDVYRFFLTRSACGGGGRSNRKAQATYQKASRHLQDDKAESAIALLQPWLDAHPRDPAAHWLMGQAYHRLGRSEDCKAAMARAVEIDPAWQERAKPYLELPTLK
jgi:cytochrome c-type biogenesis protein CcmH/NrfG